MYWLDHLGVVVSDLEQASHFYTKLLGTAVIQASKDSVLVALPAMEAHVKLIHLEGIAQTRLNPAPTDIGALHLGLYVDSAEKALARLGRPTTGSVTDIPYGPCKGGKTAYLTDPDGVNIQFMQLDQRPGKLPVTKGTDNWIDHLGIVVANLDTSLDFYSRLFETTPVQRAAWRGKDADYVAAMLGRPSGLELEAGFIQIPHSNTLLELIEYSGFERNRVEGAPTDIGAIRLGVATDSRPAGTVRDPNGLTIQLIAR